MTEDAFTRAAEAVGAFLFTLEVAADDSRRYVYAGPGYEVATGICGDLSLETLRARVHPDDRERVFARRSFAELSTLAPVVDRFRLLTDEGLERTVVARLVPRLVGRRLLVDGSLVDRTEEATLGAVLQATSDAYERVVRSINETLFSFVFAADGSRRMTFVTDGVSTLLGVDGRVATADAIRLWEAAIHPDDREEFLAWRREESLASLDVAEGRCRLVGQDGVIRHVRWRLVPRREHGRIVVDGVATDTTAQVRADEELARIARLDPLTGIANRRCLVDAFHERAPRGLLLVDLDAFGAVNARDGSETGDEVLRAVARAAVAAVGEDGLVARWDGDCLGVLVLDGSGSAGLGIVGARVCRAIATLGVTCSVGGAARTAPSITFESLADQAAKALRAAQRRGGNQVRLESELGLEDRLAEEPEGIRIAQALAVASSVREGMPALHCQQVADLSAAIAHELGLTEADTTRARIGGWLHDIGKSVIPDAILGKPGPLTEEEFAVVKNHTVAGDEIARRVAGLGSAALAVRHHHERWDGTGYPDGLRGDTIPIDARIVAVADAYSALTSDRPYHAAEPRDVALLELERCAGTHFDPAVVRAFLRFMTLERARTDASLDLRRADRAA